MNFVPSALSECRGRTLAFSLLYACSTQIELILYMLTLSAQAYSFIPVKSQGWSHDVVFIVETDSFLSVDFTEQLESQQ